MSPRPGTPAVSDGKPFSMPLFAPLYGQPPMKFTDCWSLNVPLRVRKGFTRRLVCAPMRAAEDMITVRVVSRFSPADGTRDMELNFFVPVTLEGRRFHYLFYSIVDQDAAMTRGREVWGAPKKLGFIKAQRSAEKIAVEVHRRGVRLARVEVRDFRRVPVPEKLPSNNHLCLKLIPSSSGKLRPELKQIVTVDPLYPKKGGREMFKGKASLKLGGTGQDPLNAIPVVEILEATYSRKYEYSLPAPKIIYDYLRD